MGRISAAELAELAPCSPEQVERLQGLGLLNGGEDGFPSSDVHVVRLMAAFEDAGVSVEDVARGVETGELSFPLGLFMPEPVGAATTYEELAAELGRPSDLVRRLSGELGFPPPEDDRVRAEDAEILRLLFLRLDIADDDELSRFARLYGGTIQRLVGSGLQFFDLAVRQRVATFDDLSTEEQDRLVYEKAAGYTELVASIVPWLQARHRERSVLEYLVGVTEGFMEERGLAPPQPKQPPAIAFLDLTGYTALAEEQGDEAAAELAADLATVVHEASRTYDCRPVKWLGDGVMFYFAEPESAIRSGLALMEQAEKAISVPARIGINAGPVIVQEGDYYGRTVNVAARIADYAGPHEVLVSDEALRSSGMDEGEFELVGDVPLRGVPSAVRLHRAKRAVEA
ncbi:MAG TPA: adenylate/guanylate cyclase domain-containing protein [Gaiellaceae bacterium]|nr:adenylate/guanylate cyclase domain-containing protein [Gaiellaceae bacterium]